MYVNEVCNPSIWVVENTEWTNTHYSKKCSPPIWDAEHVVSELLNILMRSSIVEQKVLPV